MIAYLAITGFESELEDELLSSNSEYTRYGSLYVCRPNKFKNQASLSLSQKLNPDKQSPSLATPLWSQQTWYNPTIININSVGDAAKQLLSQQKLWAPYSYQLHRRTQLIQEKLPKIKNKPLKFLEPLPTRQLGAYTLIDEKTMLYSPQTSSPFPLGIVEFAEDKVNPPSRAYLKLWEFFTVHKIYPQKKDRCVDLGACPGGWTWVLNNLGCEVIAVDKASIDDRLLKSPNVHYLKKDAFKLLPTDIEPVDWLLSDIICYPEKLFELVESWRLSGRTKNILCTIKFKGKTDQATLNKFKAISGAVITHLTANKHELTFYLNCDTNLK